ncbi:MAG: sulfatase-like hydrolase/transferase [Proteobacteria bacterium]|nr:sulfatase-like hydrolase/transferase [Pseudomonadota bacterium]
MSLPHLSGPTRVLLVLMLAISLLASLEILQVLPSGLGPFALAWSINNHPVSSWLCSVTVVLLLILSGRPLFSLMIAALSFSALIYASWVKIDYLGKPMTLADVRFFASNLSENAVLFNSYPALGAMLLGALMLVLLTALLIWRVEKPRHHSIRPLGSLILAGLMLGAWLAHADGLSSAFPRPAIFSDDRSLGNGFTQLQKFETTKERNPADLLEIFFTDASTRFSLPPRVSQQRFHPSSQSTATGKPDIFVVLEESTFDPALLAACRDVPACQHPMFTQAKPGQESGPLFVHTTAGGTWLSEFTFLTGFDWRVFGPAGSHAPVSLAHNMRAPLPKHLQTLGYQTIAIYPVAGNFLNARKAYQHYGFEHFLAVEDMNLSSDWRHTLDSALFAKALDTAAKLRDGRPLFVFLLTIRNHGPHAATLAELPSPAPPALASLPPAFADYMLRLGDSAQAMEQLEKRWLDDPHPRILAWFGDHQPQFASTARHAGNYASNHFIEQPDDNQLRFVTWYSILTNPAARTPTTTSDKVSDIAYLAPRLLQISGLPSQPSDDATRLIQQICPHGLALCADTKAVREYLSFRIWELHEVTGASQ